MQGGEPAGSVYEFYTQGGEPAGSVYEIYVVILMLILIPGVHSGIIIECLLNTGTRNRNDSDLSQVCRLSEDGDKRWGSFFVHYSKQCFSV